MGLTIHYSLRTALTEPAEVRTLVGALRRAARRLPFRRVGPVVEFRDGAADYDQGARDDQNRWLKIQAGRYLEAGDRHYSVKPRHVIAFTVEPGDGCEPANLGFCLFPPHVAVTEPGGRVRRLATCLDGWSWSSFCKTQYASDPRHGGVANFLRCHVGLVRLLDIATATGLMTVDVHDESTYWELRDLKRLVETVGEWNQAVAAVAGQIKDLADRAGVAVESAIGRFPDFEHLEADGLDRARRPGGG